MLRHSCGYYLANEGQDLRLIQDYLGQREVRHTTRYGGGAWEGRSEKAQLRPAERSGAKRVLVVEDEELLAVGDRLSTDQKRVRGDRPGRLDRRGVRASA